MKNTERTVQWIAVALSSLAFCTVAFLTFTDSLALIGKPFPGFFLYKNRVVSPIFHPHWEGNLQRIRYPWYIERVNGQRISSIRDLQAVIAAAQPGAFFSYQLRLGDQKGEKVIPVMTFTYRDWAMTYGFLFFPSLGVFFIGILSVLRLPPTVSTWALLIFSVDLSIVTLLAFDQCTAYRFGHLVFLFTACISSSGLSLALTFPEKHSLVQRRSSVAFLPYLFPALFVFAIFIASADDPVTFPRADLLNGLCIVVSWLLYIAVLTHTYLRGDTERVRETARIIFLWVFCFSGIITIPVIFLIYVFHTSIPLNYLGLLLLALPLGLSRAMLTYPPET